MLPAADQPIHLTEGLYRIHGRAGRSGVAGPDTPSRLYLVHHVLCWPLPPRRRRHGSSSQTQASTYCPARPRHVCTGVSPGDAAPHLAQCDAAMAHVRMRWPRQKKEAPARRRGPPQCRGTRAGLLLPAARCLGNDGGVGRHCLLLYIAYCVHGIPSHARCPRTRRRRPSSKHPPTARVYNPHQRSPFLEFKAYSTGASEAWGSPSSAHRPPSSLKAFPQRATRRAPSRRCSPRASSYSAQARPRVSRVVAGRRVC